MRQGECNGCGACCKFLVLNVNPAYMRPDNRRWVEMHGIRLYERDGGTWAQISLSCEHLTEDNQCAVFGTTDRPEACAVFPQSQADINQIDEWAGEKVCSYSFEAVNT